MNDLNYGIKLLANLIDWPKKDVIKSLSYLKAYQYLPRIKKNGSVRKIYAPHKKLKRLQRAILRRFLYKISLFDSFDKRFMGAVPKRSYVNNANSHCFDKINFILRIDLKDAFPSVKKEHIEKIFKEIFINEIKRVQGDRELKYKSGLVVNANSPLFTSLFPWKKVGWFKKLIIRDDSKHLLVLDQFVELLVKIVTYKGIMAQGIPTSPYLLNIVIVYSGIIKRISNLLEENRVIVERDDAKDSPVFSIYVDDFVISSTKPIRYQMISKIILEIEKSNIFKVNPKKTLYFNKNRIDPLVTGLRIVEMPQHHSNLHTKKHIAVLKSLLDSMETKKEDYEGIFKKRMKQPDMRTHFEARLPKKTVRRIRGLIHLATYYKELKSVVQGYMDNLRPIYGDNLPNQIAKPYKKYLAQIKG